MLRINKSSTEEQLIKDCRKGKSSAQRKLYERLSGKMMGVCFRYVSDRQEAEHVMVGGMIKVFEKLDQYSNEGSFEGWVRRIMVNESLMYLRKHKNMSVERDLNEVEDKLEQSISEQSLEAAELLQMINELPVGYRTVFNLYAIEGYAHAEIAKQLNISENTSKSQLSRARKFLQSKIKEEGKIENEQIQ